MSLLAKEYRSPDSNPLLKLVILAWLPWLFLWMARGESTQNFELLRLFRLLWTSPAFCSNRLNDTLLQVSSLSPPSN
jgi:hypothetical protein